MIGSCIGRIISVVSSNHQQIIRLQLFQKHSQIFIKFLNFIRVPPGISPVSPKRVEIYQIHKAKAPKFLFCKFYGLLHAMNRAL